MDVYACRKVLYGTGKKRRWMTSSREDKENQWKQKYAGGSAGEAAAMSL